MTMIIDQDENDNYNEEGSGTRPGGSSTRLPRIQPQPAINDKDDHDGDQLLNTTKIPTTFDNNDDHDDIYTDNYDYDNDDRNDDFFITWHLCRRTDTLEWPRRPLHSPES